MNIYMAYDNAPINLIDAIGMKTFTCNQSKLGCCCCCVDDLEISPNPPVAVFESYTPAAWWHPESSGSYEVPFILKSNLSCRKANKNIGNTSCGMTWKETWVDVSAGYRPWYSTDYQLGVPIDITERMGRYFMGSSKCPKEDIVRSIPDKPGIPFVFSSSSVHMELKIEVQFTSAANPDCTKVCKNQSKSATVTIKLKVDNGQRDAQYEGIEVQIN